MNIVADYSAISKPYEIALCQFLVMGQRTIIPDEVIEVIEVIEEVLEPETVLPTFAEELQQSTVNLDEASSWVLPEVIIGSAALVNVVVIPDPDLTNSIDYDAQS